jgi:uncharacterized protein (TIGR00251 family)
LFATSTWFRYDTGEDVLSLFLYVQHGARRNAFVGLQGGRLKHQVSAPATENKANKRVVDLLSEQFNLRVIISPDRNSRSKTAATLGLDRAGLARLGTLAAP